MKICDLFVFWEVWWDRPKHTGTDEITANLCQLCIDQCFECMHDGLSQVGNNFTFQPNNPGWPLLKSLSWLPSVWAANLTHKASGSLQCATYNAIVWSQDDQPSSRWTTDSSWAWGWSQYSWHAGILLGLKLCTGNEVPQVNACWSRLKHVWWNSCTYYVPLYRIYNDRHTIRTVRPDSCTSFAFPGWIRMFYSIFCGEPSKTQSPRSLCWVVVRHKLEQ